MMKMGLWRLNPEKINEMNLNFEFVSVQRIP
jgi:hypothetical protein